WDRRSQFRRRRARPLRHARQLWFCAKSHAIEAPSRLGPDRSWLAGNLTPGNDEPARAKRRVMPASRALNHTRPNQHNPTGITMPDFNRPAAYLDRLRVAERCVKSASYRHDWRLAQREMCEGILALIEALITEAERTGGKPDSVEPEKRAGSS